MNTVIFIGRLVKDPQLATSSSGKEYCQFTLAVNRQYVGMKRILTKGNVIKL